MHNENPRGICELIRERGEKAVLLLEKAIGTKRFRYAVGERTEIVSPRKSEATSDGSLALDQEEATRAVYSIYAEYEDEGIHTVGKIPDFSFLLETADGFCRLLARTLATPLSLDAIYEDSVTP